jgi:hypothetical protein
LNSLTEEKSSAVTKYFLLLERSNEFTSKPSEHGGQIPCVCQLNREVIDANYSFLNDVDVVICAPLLAL